MNENKRITLELTVSLWVNFFYLSTESTLFHHSIKYHKGPLKTWINIGFHNSVSDQITDLCRIQNKLEHIFLPVWLISVKKRFTVIPFSILLTNPMCLCVCVHRSLVSFLRISWASFLLALTPPSGPGDGEDAARASWDGGGLEMLRMAALAVGCSSLGLHHWSLNTRTCRNNATNCTQGALLSFFFFYFLSWNMM